MSLDRRNSALYYDNTKPIQNELHANSYTKNNNVVNCVTKRNSFIHMYTTSMVSQHKYETNTKK